MKNFIQNLQNKPYETRVKILWGTVSILLVILFALWVLSIKSSVSEITKENILSNDPKVFAERNEDIVRVEYVESNARGFKIYFNITNQTDDILNFPDASNITLTVNGKDYNPTQVQDRQENPFVRKVLSKTTNFGVLVFELIEGNEGKLIFDQFNYEKSLESPFKDELELNFRELNDISKLRN